MTNTAMQKYLIDGYTKVAYTSNYVYGWPDKATGMVYAYVCKNSDNLLPYITKLDRASQKNGGTYQLKFKPDMAQKAIIIEAANEIKAICTIDYMEKVRAEATGNEKNRGYIFERLVCEAFGFIQNTKANEKATDCGDAVDMDGNHYQVKFNKATYIDEKTLANFMK